MPDNRGYTISAVIPLYNKALHIASTLRSVLSQSYPAHEIIVVDDGSTDGGPDAVKSMHDERIRLIRQANQGVSAARNAGIAAASSDFVAFLDADDTWKPNHLETLHALILQYPDIGLFSTLHEIRSNGRVFMPQSAHPPGFVGKVADFYREMAGGLSLVNSSTACASRQALADSGGFPIGIHRGEDLILWAELARTVGMAHAAVCTAEINRDATNRSVKVRTQEPPAFLSYLADLMQRQAKNSERESARILFERVAFYTAAGMRESGDGEGVRRILKIVRECGFWSLFVAVQLISAAPPSVLRIARRFRHRNQTCRR